MDDDEVTIWQGAETRSAAARRAVVAPAVVAPSWQWVTVGALCGLVWAAALRAYMVQLAGIGSAFEWPGTFFAVLLPGLLTGALLGWAAAQLATGRTRGLAWIRFSPLLFAVATLLLPGALLALVTEGLGGGAVAVPLMGIVGGYALGQMGPRWARIIAGVVAFLSIAATAASVPIIGGEKFAATEPRGVWAMTLAGGLVAVLMLASSIPWRRTPVGYRGSP